MSESTHIDNNPNSIYGVVGRDISGEDRTNLDATVVDAPLKLSHSQHIIGTGLKIAQGQENSVDMNVCEDVDIAGDFGLPDASGKKGRADQVFTIKGGSKRIRVAGKVFSEATRGKAQVVVGEWSDQSYVPSSQVTLDLFSHTVEPVYYATGWVVPFTVHGKTGMKWLFWESVGHKIYWVTKWLVRLVLRIPQGTKGPNWL